MPLGRIQTTPNHTTWRCSGPPIGKSSAAGTRKDAEAEKTGWRDLWIDLHVARVTAVAAFLQLRMRGPKRGFAVGAAGIVGGFGRCRGLLVEIRKTGPHVRRRVGVGR